MVNTGMEENQENDKLSERGETGAAIGGAAGGAVGESVGAAYGGPVGAMVGKYVGEKVGSYVGDKVEDKLNEQIEKSSEKKKGGSCGGGSGGAGVGEYSASDGQCHKNPKTPLFKLEIEENDIPENWWDKLPDFDPRVYDAISMEQASACIDYIFKDLPEIHDLEHSMQARGFRKICPRLKTQVPRTKLIKPKEIIYDTTIDSFIKKDQTY